MIAGLAQFLSAFSEETHASCSFQGQEIAEGQGVQVFKDAFVPIGESCVSQMRVCQNRKLKGGYTYPTCKPVRFVNPPDTRPFRRSDVMFTARLSKHYYNRPWYEKFNQFHANRIVWTYAGKELLQDPKVVNKIPVQCALEYWVPATHPQRDQMSCLKKDSSGEVLGYAEHPVYKLRIPDTNTKVWRDYAFAQARELVFLGCSSFVQDVPAIMATTRNTRSFIGDGCHSQESESQFQSYNRENPEATYPDFMRYSVMLYHDWLHEKIRQAAKDYDPKFEVYFAANTSAVTPSHITEDRWFFPYFDFLQSEVFGDFSHNSTSKTITELLRYLSAKESKAHPNVLTIRSDSTLDNNIAYLRRATMSTYSLGMVPMIPWTASALADKPLEYFFGEPRDFSDIYKMVRSSPKLFDDFGPSDIRDLVRPGETKNVSQSLRTSSVDFLVTSRSHVGNNFFKIIFLVNWTGKTGSAWIDLKKSEFRRLPNFMLTIGDSKRTPIKAEDNGMYYRFNLESVPEWMILYFSE
jgi:hypothetical protein